LKYFVEPYLKANHSNPIQTKTIRKPQVDFVTLEGTIEVFHFFQKQNLKATASFEPKTKKINYNGATYGRPSKAAIKANEDFTNKTTSLNGWIFWSYLDENGIEKTIENLR